MMVPIEYTLIIRHSADGDAGISIQGVNESEPDRKDISDALEHAMIILQHFIEKQNGG